MATLERSCGAYPAYKRRRPRAALEVRKLVPAIIVRSINRRHVHTKQREIYQSPACTYEADNIYHIPTQREVRAGPRRAFVYKSSVSVHRSIVLVQESINYCKRLVMTGLVLFSVEKAAISIEIHRSPMENQRSSEPLREIIAGNNCGE